MNEDLLLERLPKEPTVKHVRLALKFGKEFNQLDKMSRETEDQTQALDYFDDLLSTSVDFLRTILGLKPKESKELEDWPMTKLTEFAFTVFYELINPNGDSLENAEEGPSKK